MTNRLELNWKLDGLVDEQRYYCSETPIDTANLPVPKAVLASHVRSYVDTDIELGNTYYVVVSSIKGNIEKVSQVIEVVAGGDPHWDKVVALLHFDGNLTDEAAPNRTWSGSYVAALGSGLGGSPALDKSSRISVPDSGSDLPTPWVFYGEPCTLEFFLRRDSALDTGNIISLWPSNIRFKCEVLSSNLVFTAFIGSVITMTFGIPFIDNNLEHIAIVRGEDGIFSAFRRGVKLSETYGPYSGEVYSGTGGSVTAGGVTFDELRITKGVARYTENFTPPDAPFPNY